MRSITLFFFFFFSFYFEADSGDFNKDSVKLSLSFLSSVSFSLPHPSPEHCSCITQHELTGFSRNSAPFVYLPQSKEETCFRRISLLVLESRTVNLLYLQAESAVFFLPVVGLQFRICMCCILELPDNSHQHKLK